MDQQGQSSAMNYGSNPYQTNPMTTAAPAGSDHPAYHQIHQQQQQQLTQQLQSFWETQFKEIEKTTDFKNHSLPLARIKKIMKADEDVRMISAEAPVVFARACEMFILELTLRSWNHTEENKRRTLQKNDIAAAVTRTDIFDFLVDIVPREDLRDEVLGGVGAEAATASGTRMDTCLLELLLLGTLEWLWVTLVHIRLTRIWVNQCGNSKHLSSRILTIDFA